MRISLGGMMWLVTLMSVLCLLFFVVPFPYDLLLLTSLTFSTLPAGVIVGCIYSYGEVRAFFLGTALGAGVPVLITSVYLAIALGNISDFSDDPETQGVIKFILAGLWMFAGLAGAVSWITYRWCRRDDPSKNEGVSGTSSVALESAGGANEGRSAIVAGPIQTLTEEGPNSANSADPSDGEP